MGSAAPRLILSGIWNKTEIPAEMAGNVVFSSFPVQSPPPPFIMFMEKKGPRALSKCPFYYSHGKMGKSA